MSETPQDLVGWRIGDDCGDITDVLDSLTAQLLRRGITMRAYDELEKLWEYFHGSAAVYRLLVYVSDNDDAPSSSVWQVSTASAEAIKEATSNFE